MIGFLTANGKSSADFNIYLTDGGVYGLAERDVDVVKVPGRNGDLLIDKDCYKNKSMQYKCVIRDNFDVNFSAFIGYLLTQKGYIRLEDSFHPDEYVLARYTGETEPQRVYRDVLGSFTLTFDRKPQRFLKEGEQTISFATDGMIYSPYMTTALPLVRVYGNGQVGIGDRTITISGAGEYTDIDCDMQNAYQGSINRNSNITLNSGGFFRLLPGENGVALRDGVTQIDIIPRWWRL